MTNEILKVWRLIALGRVGCYYWNSWWSGTAQCAKSYCRRWEGDYHHNSRIEVGISVTYILTIKKRLKAAETHCWKARSAATRWTSKWWRLETYFLYWCKGRFGYKIFEKNVLCLDYSFCSIRNAPRYFRQRPTNRMSFLIVSDHWCEIQSNLFDLYFLNRSGNRALLNLPLHTEIIGSQRRWKPINLYSSRGFDLTDDEFQLMIREIYSSAQKKRWVVHWCQYEDRRED